MRLGAVKTNDFVRSTNLRKPRNLPDTKKEKTLNAIWSRVHRITARDNFAEPLGEDHVLGCKQIDYQTST